jgi:hypothetical protein
MAAFLYLGNMVKGAIEAPLIAERDKAEASAKEWKQAAENEAKAKAWLNQVILEREGRERELNLRLGAIERGLQNLKNPKAIEQRDMRLHPEFLRESAYTPPGGPGLQGGPGSPAAGRAPDGSAPVPSSGRGGLPDRGRPGETQESSARPSGQGERPSAGRGEEMSMIDRLKEWLK